MDKLGGYRREEECRMAAVTFAPLEEEASPEHTHVGKRLGYRSRDCGLAGTCHAVQPEDAFAVASGAPCQYLPQDVDSCSGMTSGIVGVVVRIERRPSYRSELCQNDLLMNIEKQYSWKFSVISSSSEREAHVRLIDM